jgi:hypothetical protein
MVIAAGLMIPAIKQEENALALSSARLGAQDYLAHNQSLALTSLSYYSSPTSVIINATVFYGNTQLTNNQGLLDAMIYSISQTLTTATGVPEYGVGKDCIQSIFNKYCVVS